MPAMSATEDWTRAADPARRIGRTVEFHTEIGSTNDRSRVALGEPGGDGLAVVADLQTAGRGRRGRTWISPAGANLLVSVAFRPAIAPGLAGLLGVAAALAVRDACALFAPNAGLAIRWPNDVVTRDGRKVAGLLVETALEGEELVEVVVGMGINVNWLVSEMPSEIRERATSLVELTGGPVDRVELLRWLLDALGAEVTALEHGNTPLVRLRTTFWLEGRDVEVDTGTGTIGGRAEGIADDGSLLLGTAHGHVAVGVGEVVRVHELAPAAVPE